MMTRQHGGKGMKHAKASLSKVVEDVQRNSVFGRYSEVDMIAQLKGIALDPCKERDNIQPLYEQILKLRKVMTLKDSEIPWRKRKLEQFVKDKLKAPSNFVLSNPQNTTKRNRRQLSLTSSVASLSNSVDSTTQSQNEKNIFDSHTCSSLLTFEDALPEKQISTEYSFQDDIVHWNCNFPSIDISIDSDESVNGSKPPSPLYGAHSRQIQPRRRSVRLLNFIGDHLQRKAIPIGTRFQANVPEWNGPLNRSLYKSNSDNSKWLGSRVWPIKIGNMKITEKTIGKGRPNSCFCFNPLSADCVKRHILEKKLLLKCELGPAFYNWKFDEMGEQISKSWSLEERETFESLVKVKPSSKKSFLKRASKCFPNKYRKDIVNYYFNVYVPQHMSLQTRSVLLKQVDTDDEDGSQDCNYLGLKKRSEGRNLLKWNSVI